jgi:hypothetical protein
MEDSGYTRKRGEGPTCPNCGGDMRCGHSACVTIGPDARVRRRTYYCEDRKCPYFAEYGQRCSVRRDAPIP